MNVQTRAKYAIGYSGAGKKLHRADVRTSRIDCSWYTYNGKRGWLTQTVGLFDDYQELIIKFDLKSYDLCGKCFNVEKIQEAQ